MAPAPRRRAPLTWLDRWRRHPWAAFWLLTGAWVAGIFLFGFEDSPLHVRPSPLSRVVAGAGLVLLYLTFVQGMRVTWRRVPFTALGIGAPAAEHEAKARASGLFFFRWVCVVEHVDGKVTATRTFILD